LRTKQIIASRFEKRIKDWNYLADVEAKTKKCRMNIKGNEIDFAETKSCNLSMSKGYHGLDESTYPDQLLFEAEFLDTFISLDNIKSNENGLGEDQ
jgi:hypothetical protein